MSSLGSSAVDLRSGLTALAPFNSQTLRLRSDSHHGLPCVSGLRVWTGATPPALLQLAGSRLRESISQKKSFYISIFRDIEIFRNIEFRNTSMSFSGEPTWRKILALTNTARIQANRDRLKGDSSLAGGCYYLHRITVPCHVRQTTPPASAFS